MSRPPSRGCSILRHLVLLAATCLPAGFAASPARAADDEPAPGEAHLPETVVIGRPASGPRGLPDAAAAADRLDAVPGNTDLIEADGFTRTQFVDPLLIRYAAVYPGANGLEHGAATLGGAVNLVVLLGNHGNGHRDFRIAGKARLGAATFTWIRPGSARHDLKPRAIDLGHESDDGHWAVRLLPEAPGTHAIAYLGDRVVHYAPKRSIHSAKTFFRVEAGADAPRALEPLGHPLELVPLADPAGTAADGGPIRVRLLFRGEPMAGARVSFIPRSVTLEGDFDPDYERRTDAGGVATFPPPGKPTTTWSWPTTTPTRRASTRRVVRAASGIIDEFGGRMASLCHIGIDCFSRGDSRYGGVLESSPSGLCYMGYRDRAASSM